MLSKMLCLVTIFLLGMISKSEALDMTDRCQWNYTVKVHTVKPVLSGYSKVDKTKVLKTNGIKVESIAESILQYF